MLLIFYDQHLYRENSVVLINHGLGDRLVVLATDSTLSSFDGDQSDNAVEWTECDGTIDYTNGFRLTLSHTKVARLIDGRGMYVLSLLVWCVSTADGSAGFMALQRRLLCLCL